MWAEPSPTWSCAMPRAPSASTSRPRCRPIPARAFWACCAWPPNSSTCRSPALLRDCALFVHGSTVATNTILEKKGAKVGMLTTEGFRDSLEIRRGFRDNQWDHRAPFPPVLAPRYLRLPVRGRIGADGKELAPLIADDVDAAAQAVRRRRRRIRRRLPVQQLSRRRARARSRRAVRQKLGWKMDLAVERGHADHGRVRARLDRRGQRLHRAQGDELPRARSTNSSASSACRAPCSCCRATAAPCRSRRSRPGR